jgi:predicted TIM-barrel enzyme
VIVPRTSRSQILQKLRAKMEQRLPVFIASAGSGLVAKLLEAAGVDCVNTFSGARLRANGMGTMSMLWPILDSNKQTLDYTREDILPAMKGEAFVCACLNANDPLKDMRMVLAAAAGDGRGLGVEHRTVDLVRRQGQPDLPRADERRDHAAARDRAC